MAKKKPDSKPVLWANAQALMKERYGEEHYGKFAKDAGIGASSVTRMRKEETSVGIDVLDSIAEGFGVEPWRLLLPGMKQPATANGLALAPDALQVALHFNDIKDPAQRASMHALIDMLLLGHVSPAEALEKVADRIREIGAAIAAPSQPPS